jgi:hypothetical protein
MRKESVDDLHLLFLELIAEKAPRATDALFNLRDASSWMDAYGVSSDWLESFLMQVLEEEQKHMDWVAKQVAKRTFLATPIYWQPNPAGHATFGRVRLSIYIRRIRVQSANYTYWRKCFDKVGDAVLGRFNKGWQVSAAAAAAWRRTLTTYRAAQAIWSYSPIP